LTAGLALLVSGLVLGTCRLIETFLVAMDGPTYASWSWEWTQDRASQVDSHCDP
jgi:hypothetical protein